MRETEERYIVFVSYFYPPNAAVGGLRVQGFASRIAERSGDSLRGLVVTVGGDFEWSNEDGVDVLRCPDLRFRYPRGRTKRSDRITSASTASVPKPRFHRRALRRVANDVLIPDEQALGLLQSPRITAEVMNRTGGAIAAVFASTPPPSGLLIAKRLSMVSGAPYIADFRDSWVQNPHWHRSAWRVQIDKLLQSSLLKSIDLIVSPSPAIMSELPGAVQLPTGFDESVAECSSGAADPDQFVLLHAGQLYGDRRDPRPVVQTARLLAEMNGISGDRLKAVFLGDDAGLASAAAEEMGLGSYCDSMVSVPPEQAKMMMATAGALVSLSWDEAAEDGAIPGKIFEYMATGRPTVAYGGSARTVGALLSESGAGIHACAPEVAARYLDPYVKAWLQGRPLRTELTSEAVTKAGATDMLLRLVEGLNMGSRS